jgi:membrane protein
VNLAAVSWIGFALIAYAAIGLMVTIENSFNTIFRAPAGRPWIRRIPLYWFVLTVSPVAMGATWYLNVKVASWIESVEGWQFVLVAASTLWSFGVTWLVMLAIYMLVPNAGVAWRPAMGGALVAALLLEIGKRSLDAYLGNAFAVSQLYGSLGLVPLFMFWVYLMWLAVLFGLEVCAILQRLEGRELESMEPTAARTGLLDPAAVIEVAEHVAASFAEGAVATSQQIADSCALPIEVVEQLLDSLVVGGILHRVGNTSPAVTLARPPERVAAQELIEIGFRLADEGGTGHRSRLVDRLRDAQRELLAATTLASLTTTEH